MADYKTNTLILGATFYGCGLACRIKDALVVESSTAVGSDYAYAFEQGVNWNTPAENADAEEFRQELFKRKAVDSEGRLLTGALVPVFSDWCVKRNIRPLLGLELAEKHGNTLKFVDFCGKIITIEAENIIDARPQKKEKKTFTAAIYSALPLAPGRYSFFDISQTVAQNICYLAFEVDGDTTFQSARQRFAALWDARPQELAQAQVIWSAVRFSENSFDNPVSALDCGLGGKIFSSSVPDTVEGEELTFDTVVCGLGTAGITAAIAAAQRGMKVLAIEKSTYPGGVWTGGFIPVPYIQKNCGIAADLQEKAYKLDGYFGQSENLKIRLEKAALGKIVRIMYSSVVCGCETKNGRVTQITFRDEHGTLRKVSAHSFIDATAEGVLCRLAGAKMSCGRALDREFNSYTNTMGIFRGASFGAANFDAGRIAQYDVNDFSSCYLETCNVHLRNDYSELNYCIQASDNPGLREGERIITDEPWTLGKYFEANGKCEDVIFNVISNLDTHAQDIFFESEEFQDWNIAASCWDIRISIPVPMRALFPAGIGGIIVPARHLGVDHDLGCAVRMISGLTAIGEVAGAISAVAKKRNISPEKVSYEDIKADIPQKNHSDEINLAWTQAKDSEIEELLGSENPALGIWNIKQQNKKEFALKFFAEHKGTPAGYNAAFALAMLGEKSVTPALCELIEKDDTTLINSTLRYSAPRRVAAAYLLGRLRQAETAEFLISQLHKRDCEKFFAHVVCALLKIGDANREKQQLIGKTLRELAEDTSWQMIEQLKGAGAFKRRSDGLLRWHIAKHLDKWAISHKIAEAVSSVPFDSHEKWLWKNL